MNIYSIRWYGNGGRMLLGELESVMALANTFETLKVHYKIADCSGFMLTQSQLGSGGFEYWLEPDAKFS